MAPTVSLIAAVANNMAIGLKGDMPWHIPEDLKHFKKLTTGFPVIMGRKTYESLPCGPLKNRKNIVITRKKSLDADGVFVAANPREALELANSEEEVFIIGGGEIYNIFLPLADKIYLTEIDSEFPADTFFPLMDKKKWSIVEQSDKINHNDISFRFVTYMRNK